MQFQYILGSRIGGYIGRVGVLFKSDIKPIFDWANENIPLAPERLAMLVPIYDGHNNQYNQLHPITQKLIDDFGNIKNVLSELNANMGTYSWTGSIVPLLKSQLEIFETLINHKHEEVRDWANYKIKHIEKEIILENNRDQELYL